VIIVAQFPSEFLSLLAFLGNFAQVSSDLSLVFRLTGWNNMLLLGLAALLDYWIGDPWNWLHPVQIMGLYIRHYSQLALKLKSPLKLRLAGIGLAVTTIGFSGLSSWLLIEGVSSLHPLLGLVTEALLLASCFAGRSLRAATEAVLAPLKQGDLMTARAQLSRYVGRDTEQLPTPEILRAVLETATENATDGVMAPLFYGLLGTLLPCGSAPLALAYKAASTLDSMVGYREAPYTDLGWFSARLEDGLTWLPCRLHVLTLSLLSGQPQRVWQLCHRDAPQDPSPNSGWSECAYAAALGVQLGGPNYYKGLLKQKPLLGEALRPITPGAIQQATRLTRDCFLIWLMIFLIGYGLWTN
jgi:adenosylcobinamide-phosphate synthase